MNGICVEVMLLTNHTVHLSSVIWKMEHAVVQLLGMFPFTTNWSVTL